MIKVLQKQKIGLIFVKFQQKLRPYGQPESQPIGNFIALLIKQIHLLMEIKCSTQEIRLRASIRVLKVDYSVSPQ